MEDFRVKTGVCSLCHKRGQPIHRHHLDYEKDKIIIVCASCHKKIHNHLNGTVRQGSKPYLNPLRKMEVKCGA